MQPRPFVEFINQLYHGQNVDKDCLEAVNLEFLRLELWLQAEEGFWVVEEERQQLEEVRGALRQLGQSLDQAEAGATPRWQDIHHPLQLALSIIREVNERRERSPYSKLPAFHHCILACGAVILGQGRWDILPTRVAVAEQYLVNLEPVFAAMKATMPEDVKGAIEVGFLKSREALGQALAAVEAQRGEELRGALRRLAQAGELLEVVPRAHQEMHQEGQDSRRRFNIPLIGYRLQHDLETTAEVARRYWPRGAKFTLENSLPELENFWQRQRRGFILPPAEREEVLLAVESGLSHLEQAYMQVFQSEVTDEQVRQDLESAMEALSRAFSRLEQVSLRTEVLASELARTSVEDIRGVLLGQRPDVVLVDLISALRGLPAWAVVVEHLQAYLNSGEQESLPLAAFAAVEASQTLATGADGLSVLS